MLKRFAHTGLALIWLLGLMLTMPPRTALAAGNMYVVTGTADTSPIPVCTGGPTTFSCPTLRAAVLAANAAAGADTIQLSHGATYTLAIPPSGGNDASSGDLNLTSDVTISLPSVICFPVCGAVIQGGVGWNDGILSIQSGITVNLSQLTIRYGHSATNGGGIYNSGTLIIANSTVTSNTASLTGGGIFSPGLLTFVNSVLSNNVADVAGGLYTNGLLTITSSSIFSNTALTGSGGGVYHYSNVAVLSNTVFQGNTARSGGGLFNNGVLTLIASTVISNVSPANAVTAGGAGVHNVGQLSINTSVIQGNSTTNFGSGGGIFNREALTITMSSIQNNAVSGAGYGGGGIYNYLGLLTINQSTIVSNTSGAEGGGISNAAALNLSQSTLSGNSAKTDGGGLFSNVTPAGPLVWLNYVTLSNNTADSDQNGSGNGGGIAASTAISITNSLVGGNLDKGGQAPDCSGSLASLGYNLIQNNLGCTLTGVTLGNLLGASPLLGPLQNNGGPTLTQALLVNSPAIDAADPNNCPVKDQRDYDRPGGIRCDIGAYEYAGAPALKLFLPLVRK